MKNILIILLIGIGFYQWSTGDKSTSSAFNNPTPSFVESKSGDTLENAYENGRSHVQVNGVGTVIKLLRDDNDGSRHQKFILRLTSGQTILVAHNIDLAPRINSLSKGDQVEFYGEYEWNNKGGVVHWTHQDPRGQHIAGWLKHSGRTYQ